MNRYQTISTFTRSPVFTQIAAYIVYIGQALTFFICMFPNFKNETSKSIILGFFISTAIIEAVVSFICSYIDPSDSTMIQFRNNRSKTTDLKDCLYCDICQSYVKESSRHCRQCQRCVEDFDHHCIWINNCIGGKNYKIFFFMITITLLNMIVYLIGVGLLWGQHKWRQYLTSMIFLWIFSVILIILVFLLTNLILLHIYLNVKGLTTYQFIMLQRQQQKRKKQMKEKKALEEQRERDQNEVTIIPVKEKQNKNDFQMNNIIKQPTFSKNKNGSENENIIFGNYVSSSHNTDKQSQHQLSQNKNSQDKDHQNEDNDNNSLSSKNASSVNLSQFFTRNKSLKFLVGDQIGQRPHTTKVHNQIPNYNSHKMIGSQIQKMKKIKSKQMQKSLQYSTQNNNKKTGLQFSKPSQFKIFSKNEMK